jgi:hypothetical protein
VVVALGDAILEPRDDGGPEIVSRLIDAHAAHGADATIAVTEVPASQTGRYGIVIGSPLEPDRGTGAPEPSRGAGVLEPGHGAGVLEPGRGARVLAVTGSSRSRRRARSPAGWQSPRATCSGRRCSRRCATRRPAAAARSS